MSDTTEYTPVLFAQDIRNSAYKLPALAQQYLRRAHALRLEPVNEAEEKKARSNRGVQWFVGSMAYVIRPRTDEQKYMILTRVLMADKSLATIMDTVEEGVFIPDDWVSMFGLLTDELSFRDYGDLILEIFKPFVGWMELRPSTPTKATTPTLIKPAESIAPPPLFLPSPSIPTSKLKRARPVSPTTAEAQSSKRTKIGDENAPPPLDGIFREDVPSLSVVPATPFSISTKVGSEKVPRGVDTLGPAIALAPTVWRVSSSSPLAPQIPRFPCPCISVSASRAPTPPSSQKEKKSVFSSRSKFTPSRNSGSGTVPTIGKDVTSGKLESSSKSMVVSRSEPGYKPVQKSASSSKPAVCRKSVPPGKSMTPSKSSSKSVASSESNLSSKSINSSKFIPSSKSSKDIPPRKSASSEKSSVPPRKSDVSSTSASSSKSATTGKFVPLKKSDSNLSSVPRTPQPNYQNLQRRLIIISPPPKPTKSTHRS